MAGKGVETKATSPGACMYSRNLTPYSWTLTAISPDPKKLKLQPMWEPIVSVDEAGNGYVWAWDTIEVELDGPVIDGAAKITGTVMVAPELEEWQ